MPMNENDQRKLALISAIFETSSEIQMLTEQLEDYQAELTALHLPTSPAIEVV